MHAMNETHEKYEELERQLDSLGNPYKEFAAKAKSKLHLDYTPVINSKFVHAKTREPQRMIVEYLFRERPRSRNPVSYDVLRMEFMSWITAEDFQNAMASLLSRDSLIQGVGVRELHGRKYYFVEDRRKLGVSRELLKDLNLLRNYP
jgi:hypothetical protein